MLTVLRLLPPLAFARIGRSSYPLDCFLWGPSDNTPEGTGKTTILPMDSVVVHPNGETETHSSRDVVFRDKAGLRPVCPFFELHGEWMEGDRIEKGPVTPNVLRRFGYGPESLRWSVRLANLKAFHRTRSFGDRIDGIVQIDGNDCESKNICGVSPTGPLPLIPYGKSILLGKVQLTAPRPDDPFRLRFRPPRGDLYASKGLLSRDPQFRVIPPCHLILNEDAVWSKWVPPARDKRKYLESVTLAASDNRGAGIVDDLSDGIVSCCIKPLNLHASARVAVTPPDYAPDRRHFAAISDGLKDRTDRQSVRNEQFYTEKAEKNAPETLGDEEMRDLMERIYEVMGLVNVEAFSNRVSARENRESTLSSRRPFLPGELDPFPLPTFSSNEKFPVSEAGRRRHRRFVSLDVWKRILRSRPELIRELVRPPASTDPVYDKRMPPVSRGSDNSPLTVTRRQYDFLIRWASNLGAAD